MTLILASASETRATLLRSAGVNIETTPARVDEAAIRAGLAEDNVSARDVADALADAKARKIGSKRPDRLVLGADQVLDLDGRILSKPCNRPEAAEQLGLLSGRSHKLHSALVAYEDGAPVWRHVGTVKLTMRPISAEFIAGYLERNWQTVQHSPGAYRLEGESARFFIAVEGSYFDVLGLPLIPLLSWLVTRGYLPV